MNESNAEALARLKANLHEVAVLLRDAEHLSPEAQQELASLLDELRDELDPGTGNAEHAAQLAESLANLGRALHARQPQNLLDAARDGVQDALARFEGRAPVVAGIARRFMDALASLGI